MSSADLSLDAGAVFLSTREVSGLHHGSKSAAESGPSQCWTFVKVNRVMNFKLL